jgi:hypothetical protein
MGPTDQVATNVDRYLVSAAACAVPYCIATDQIPLANRPTRCEPHDCHEAAQLVQSQTAVTTEINPIRQMSGDDLAALEI